MSNRSLALPSKIKKQETIKDKGDGVAETKTQVGLNKNTDNRSHVEEEEEEEEEEKVHQEEDEEDDERGSRTDEEEEDSEECGSSVVKYGTPGNDEFSCTFIDGATFRAVIEYLKSFSMEGTFVFTPDTIVFQKEHESQVIMNDLVIKTYHLTDYRFSSENEEIVVNTSLVDMRNRIRPVGKKEQLDIYKKGEKSNLIYLQIRSQDKGGGDNPTLSSLKMKSVNAEIFKLPQYKRAKKNPNCSIFQSDFTKFFKSLATNKCSYIIIIGFNTGFRVQGFSSDHTPLMVKEFGRCKSIPQISSYNEENLGTETNIVRSNVPAPKLTIKNPDEITRFKIYSETFKPLGKLNGFSSSGTIKVYIEKGLPLKFVVPVGTYGKLSIIIRSAK